MVFFMALLLENINPWPALESTVVMGIDQLWVILKGQPPKALCLVLKLEGGGLLPSSIFAKSPSTLVNPFYKIVLHCMDSILKMFSNLAKLGSFH